LVLQELGYHLVRFIAQQDLWGYDELMTLTSDTISGSRKQANKIIALYSGTNQGSLFEGPKLSKKLKVIGMALDDYFLKLVHVRCIVAKYMS